ncbi:MAG: hypothetical protein IJD84_01985 [Parabacteroides sp.]|nr:hypothetical protein [Parabacteroides sp.]
MKTKLQKMNVRLLMILMAVSCCVSISWGQNGNRKHKVCLYTYGNLTVDCPTVVENGKDLNFSVKRTDDVDYYVSVYRGTKVSSVNTVETSSDNYVLDKVETPVTVYVIAYDKVTVDGEVYNITPSSLVSYCSSPNTSISSKLELKNVITVDGKNYPVTSYTGVYNDIKTITSITLPSIPSSFNRYSFNISSIAKQTGLKEVHVKSVDPTVYNVSCYQTNNHVEDIILYVPTGCKEAYKAKAPWKEFKEIIEEPMDNECSVYVIGRGIASHNAPASVKRGSDLKVDVVLESGYYATQTSFSYSKVNSDIYVYVLPYEKKVSGNYVYEYTEYSEGVSLIGVNTTLKSSVASSLKEAVVPYTVNIDGKWLMVKSVRNNAFSEQTTLEKVIIESDVTIASKTFAGCTALKEIHCKSMTPPSFYKGDVDTNKCTLYIPKGAKAAYLKSSTWKDFKNIVEEDVSSVVTYRVVMPTVEGVTVNPGTGIYEVEEGSSFSFTLALEEGYSNSKPIVSVNGQSLEPDVNGSYTMTNITSDLVISITGIVPNSPTANAEINVEGVKVWGKDGILHIRTATTKKAYIVTFSGHIYNVINLSGGDFEMNLPRGSYIVRIDNEVYKVQL